MIFLRALLALLLLCSSVYAQSMNPGSRGGAGNTAHLNQQNQTLQGGANSQTFCAIDGTPAGSTACAISSGSLVINCAYGPVQEFTNSGAFTLVAPQFDSSCILLMINSGSAGAITYSGFSVGSNTGDTVATTNGNKYKTYISRISNGLSTIVSSYSWQAAQ